MQSDEHSSDIAPSLKRRKLGHMKVGQRHDRDGNAYHSPERPTLDILVHRNSSASTSRARDSKSLILHSEDINRSSMFKLQVDEMLRAVQPNYAKLREPVDKALRKLKLLIEGMEDREPVTVAEAVTFMLKSHKIKIPFPDTTGHRDAAIKLPFSRPSDIDVVGSYALKTMVKGEQILSVDMVVTLPTCILQDKDYLNYRYFYKRAYYLACIAADLQISSGDDFDLYFEYLGGNSLQPILVVKPAIVEDLPSSIYLIYIIPAAPQDFFVKTKLLPNMNALRPKIEHTDRDQILSPTPFYNATIRADSTIKQYLNLLHSTSKHTDGFKDACMLGRIWLRQRGFGGSMSAGGFGHFEWATLSALLLQGCGSKGQSIITPAYSSYQIFKAVIKYLSEIDLVSNPVSFQAAKISSHSPNVPLFFDGPRGHNILFKMTPWSYAALREEAKISVEMLNDLTFDQFEAAFIMRKDNPLQQFDLVLQLPNSTIFEESWSADHASHTSMVSTKIYAIFKEGLTDRVKIIQLKEPGLDMWPLNGTSSTTSAEITVGFVFDPLNVEKLVDHGPAAEDKKSASRFREFWGSKSELRRFKDGRILESLVWSNSSGGSVFKEVILYLLNQHFGAEISGKTKFLNPDVSRLLSSYGCSTTAFDNLKAAFNTLEQDIRGLESLPLQPKLLSAISPQLRLSSVAPPDFSRNQRLRDPVDVLLQFEGSGRWPDDLAAVQRTKIAFLLKMGTLLASKADKLVTRLRIENVERNVYNCGVLDVLYPSGATFRLRIYIDREQNLLERIVKGKIVDIHAREDAILARSDNKYMGIYLPLHTQSVGTQCTRYPALSPTIRLAKKWFNSHLLCRHFREELIELIVLHIFLQPYPWRAPSSPSTGLLRTLQFLSRWDWRVNPLIVDFSGTMTRENVTAINTTVLAWRKVDAEMNQRVLFAASNHDLTGTVLTDRSPSKVVAARMTTLARSASLLAKNQALDFNIKSLFRSSTHDYDFIIHIAPKFVGPEKAANDRNITKFKNLEIQAKEDLSLQCYEQISIFLKELERLYTTSIVFFYDPLSRSIIGGLWNPSTKSRSLKINLPYSTRPSSSNSSKKDDPEVEIDRVGILCEIARLGGDIIGRIEVHR